MIRTGLHLLPLLYAGLALGAVLALWLAGEWTRRRRRRRERRGLYHCRLCAEWIRHESKASLVRCAACGALNERARSLDL